MRGRFGAMANTCPSHSPPRTQLLGHDRRRTPPLGYSQCTHERCQLDGGARDTAIASMRATNLVAMSAQIVIAQRLHVACCVAAFTFRALHGVVYACVRAGGLYLCACGGACEWTLGRGTICITYMISHYNVTRHSKYMSSPTCRVWCASAFVHKCACRCVHVHVCACG